MGAEGLSYLVPHEVYSVRILFMSHYKRLHLFSTAGSNANGAFRMSRLCTIRQSVYSISDMLVQVVRLMRIRLSAAIVNGREQLLAYHLNRNSASSQWAQEAVPVNLLVFSGRVVVGAFVQSRQAPPLAAGIASA